MKKTLNKKVLNNIIVTLIILLCATVAIDLIAIAKYQTTVGGTATASVGKWSFTVVDGITETTDVMDFALTRTDANESVVEGKLAPGTSGKFEIGIDASGTETALEYTIDIALTNAPRNMKFYSDEGKTEELVITNSVCTEKGYMSLADVDTVRTEAIYWEWPYETGTTEEEIAANDIIDTEDAGKEIAMQIAVTGYQVTEEPRLADFVKVGDYVNYDASSNGVQTFTSGDCLAGSSISDTISTENDFNSNATSQWRVLSVDREKGIVELMAADPTAQTVTLSGGDGFANAETVLNNVGAIYGQGKGATGGRSITAEDVEQYSSYDPYTYANSNSSTGYYGGTKDYTSGTFYKEVTDNEGNVIGYEDTTTAASSSSPVTMTQTVYTYTASSYFSNSTIYNMIFKNSTSTSSNKSTYWLASRCVYLYSSYCNFRVRIVHSGSVNGNYVHDSNGNMYSPAYRVLPVVSLKSNILTTGQDESGVWQLKID